MQKIIAQFNMPGMTSQQYDHIMAELKTSGNANPKGRLQHIAAELPNNNWLITDIWDSQESMVAFADTLIPIIIGAGVTPVQPAVSPIYNYETI